jgi:hypothetical protein
VEVTVGATPGVGVATGTAVGVNVEPAVGVRCPELAAGAQPASTSTTISHKTLYLGQSLNLALFLAPKLGDTRKLVDVQTE